MLNFDARTLPTNAASASPARFTLSAHDGEVSSLDVNPHIRGCIATGGADKTVKVWNITEDAHLKKRQVSLVTSRDLGVVSNMLQRGFVATWPLIPRILSGKGLLCCLVARRSAHARCSGFESKGAGMGHRCQRWSQESSVIEACRG